MPRMSRRMRVLLSAFACEPHKGSEPEVGWQWAMQMARFHDVTVLTQSKNRAGIESALKSLGGKRPEPHFIYFDLPKWLQRLRKYSLGLRVYYVLWQKWAREEVRRKHLENPFDLLHHVTFAAFRYPAVIWGHGVPCIWGPVGGIESIPTPLLPWTHPVSFVEEVFRNFSNLMQAAPYHDLPKRAAASDTVLVSTLEMQNSLAALDIPSRLMPTIGLETRELTWQSHRPSEGPLRLLFVGKIITLKGIDLALKALGASDTDATLTVIGTGNFLSAAQRLVKKLRLEKRVTFRGQLTREQVLNAYSEFDLMLFPSLHDTGGYAVIEAMFNELPVICLDCGGPAVAVQPGCGIRVPIGPRRRVIAGLADGIRLYDRDRGTLLIHGQAARQSILKNYDWDQKGEQMREVYEETLTQATEQSPAIPKHVRTALAARRLVSFKGSLVATALLLLVGMIGFLSLNHLKNQADLIVNDTLPGLSYSGEANAYIVDASRTLLFVTDKDAGRRRQIQNEIDAIGARTTKYLALYRSQIFDEEDRTNFEHLIEVRGKYVEIREQVLNLAAAGREKEALIVYNESLMPMHAEVKEAADKLFEYNMKQGQLRGQRIMRFCTITQIVLGAASVAVFALGFFFGLFK
jgi:glycosyltransferase involved in cell wall biosynthesis